MGTAKKFALDNGVQIIGKTGTGQMVGENGTYSSTNYTKSFAGMAPYEDPQIVTIVVFQGPDNNTTDHQANIIKNIVPSALSVISSYNASNNEILLPGLRPPLPLHGESDNRQWFNSY